MQFSIDNIHVTDIFLARFGDRRLEDGNVHSAGSATYQICVRLSIPNPNPEP